MTLPITHFIASLFVMFCLGWVWGRPDDPRR